MASSSSNGLTAGLPPGRFESKTSFCVLFASQPAVPRAATPAPRTAHPKDRRSIISLPSFVWTRPQGITEYSDGAHWYPERLLTVGSPPHIGANAKATLGARRSRPHSRWAQQDRGRRDARSPGTCPDDSIGSAARLCGRPAGNFCSSYPFQAAFLQQAGMDATAGQGRRLCQDGSRQDR